MPDVAGRETHMAVFESGVPNLSSLETDPLDLGLSYAENSPATPATQTVLVLMTPRSGVASSATSNRICGWEC